MTFKNFANKGRRKGNKTAGEGVESSSHVVIKPSDDPRVALVTMSMGSGISSTIVERTLGIALAALKGDAGAEKIFVFQHPSGAQVNGIPATYNVRYAFECVGYKGTALDEALQKGTFESMQLVAHKFDKFDSSGNLQIEEYSLGVKARVPQAVTGSAIKNAFRAYMKNKATLDYDQLRIRYKKQDGDSAVASLNANNLDDAFTKREKIKLDVGLDEQQSHLSQEVIAKMLALM